VILAGLTGLTGLTGYWRGDVDRSFPGSSVAQKMLDLSDFSALEEEPALFLTQFGIYQSGS
jgi:hypothetical protein